MHRIVREAEPEGTAARTPVSSSPGSPRDDSWSRTCLATASAVSFTAERGQFVATTDDGASGDAMVVGVPAGVIGPTAAARAGSSLARVGVAVG